MRENIWYNTDKFLINLNSSHLQVPKGKLFGKTSRFLPNAMMKVVFAKPTADFGMDKKIK
jgi:hypothetical protein